MSVPNGVAGTLSYYQYAWAAEKSTTLNTTCEVVTAVNAAKAKWFSYRQEVAMKEDRDFAMQIVSSGNRTVRASRCWFQTEALGAKAGGLQSDYRAKKDEIAAKRMAQLWPQAVKLIRKENGMLDIKINWRALAPR